MRRQALVAFAAGLLFAIGLGVSGMTSPAKVLGFLDVTGVWDPSLAFVMMGAIGVHLFFARRALRTKAPLFAPRFALPERRDLGASLIAGSAIFGIGWGLAGYCPGPALVAAGASTHALPFLFAMLGGMWVTGRLRSRLAERPPDSDHQGGVT